MVQHTPEKKCSGTFAFWRFSFMSFCNIPFICAYTIDKSNGKQTSKRWVWGLVITIIVILFVIRVVKDYRIVKARQNEKQGKLNEGSCLFKQTIKIVESSRSHQLD